MNNIHLRNLLAMLIIAIVSTLGVIIISCFTLSVANRSRMQQPLPPPAQTQNYSPQQNATQ